jgi:hypothetical protein
MAAIFTKAKQQTCGSDLRDGNEDTSLEQFWARKSSPKPISSNTKGSTQNQKSLKLLTMLEYTPGLKKNLPGVWQH